jgi:hypothetical protein
MPFFFAKLPTEIQSEICMFFDAVSLARFEGTHKCDQTSAAWARLVRSRFRLYMANPPYFNGVATPRDVFQRLLRLGGVHALPYFKLSDAALIKMVNRNLNHLLHMTPPLSTLQTFQETLGVFCWTTPSCGTVGGTGLLDGTPSHTSTESAFEECVYEHWLMIRELTQRGIVASGVMLQPLKAGDKVMHMGRLQTGMSGMSSLLRFGGDFQVKVSRVNSVFNGVVQYQELMSNPNDDVHPRLRVGWALRGDMFVLNIS